MFFILFLAEANAASGGFAVPIPLSIPSGSGFSGSFSKSSSSSFASSSASSSSSSSSYTFSGTGANGLAGNSAPSALLHGSSGNQNGFGASGSLASAASGANAIAGSSALSHNVGLPCAGSNCNNADTTNNKCSSAACESGGYQNNINANKNCLSGQCQPSSSSPNKYEEDLQTANSPSLQQHSDLDDFEVKIGGNSKSSGHTSGSDKYGSQNSQTDCSYGKCGTNINGASPLPTTSINNEKPLTKDCSSPNSGCDNFIPLAHSGSASPTNPQHPSIHLTAPDIDPACSSHNCNPALTGASLTNGKPSSYQVPILGSNAQVSPNYDSNANTNRPLYDLPSGSPSKPQVTHKIPSYADGTYSSQLPIVSAGSPGCNGPSCDSLNNPAYQSSSKPSCNSPNCGGYPVGSGPNFGSIAGSTQSGSFDASGSKHESSYNHNAGHSDSLPKPSYNHPSVNVGSFNGVPHPASLEVPKTNVLSPSQNTPGYTGGFGAPVASNNAYLEPVKSNIPITPDLNTGLKPGSSAIYSSQSLPSYTGGFGGSPGTFDTDTGARTQYKPKPANENPSPVPTTVPHNNGISAGSGPFALPKPDFGLPSSQNNPSYTGFTSSANIHSGLGTHGKPHDFAGVHVTGLHGSFGIKPETSGQKTSTYTGSFGGSPGSFDTGTKINTYSEQKPTHSNIPSSPNTASPSYGHNIHTGSGSTENSGSQTSHHSLDIHKPSESFVPPNTETHSTGYITPLKPGVVKPVDEKAKLPPYSGGFGAPSGILKPNEYSVSANLPTSPSAPCTSGGCGSTIGHNYPIGKENIHSSGASSDASASANAKAAAYSGGFNGPPGFLKNPAFNEKNFKIAQDGDKANDGKVGTEEYDKLASGVHSENENTHSVNDAESSGVNKAPSSLAIDGANANAAAFANSNAFSANQGSSGCNSGCGSKSGVGGNYASSLGSLGALGGHDGLLGSLSSANSVAGAGSGTFGAERSFASSSATAHAGAAVKGGNLFYFQ